MLTPARRLALASLGAFAGFASGFFGIGGGVVLVSALRTVFGYPLRVAIACSMIVVLPLASVGATSHLLRTPDAVAPGMVALLALGAVAGSRLGVLLRVRVPERWLGRAFALVLAFAAYRLIAGATLPPGADALAFEHWPLVFVGLAAGMASSLFGLGGGVVIIPALVLVWQMPMRPPEAIAGALGAVPTSLSAVVLIAAAGVFFQRKLGDAHAKTVLWILAPGAIAAVCGVTVLYGIKSGNAVKQVFGVLLALLSLRLAISGAGRPRAEPPSTALPPAGAGESPGAELTSPSGSE